MKDGRWHPAVPGDVTVRYPADKRPSGKSSSLEQAMLNSVQLPRRQPAATPEDDSDRPSDSRTISIVTAAKMARLGVCLHDFSSQGGFDLTDGQSHRDRQWR
jgi:hypothetical protein